MVQISLFVGGIRLLPESGRPTGIYKQPASGPLELGPAGFVADRQADLRVHGGPEKAVHLYPAAHYARLATRFPEIAEALVPGSLGENLSASGLDETGVGVGDVWQLGSARLQVCQPRTPCWKIDERFATEGIAQFIAEQQLTGWYWRVLSPGIVAPGDPLRLEQAGSGPTLAAAMQLWQSHRPPVAALEQLAATPGIAEHWRQKIDQRCAWLRSNPETPAKAPTSFHVKPEQA
ncbi:MOSC domain-containing protein YiiM [Azonexus fungiphilus]|uniref:MOSC domain-containing protein YiiM n=1 Tax=Azonexus fungiphilus TaxID=146940 RepID=A0A495VP45_9RHOO|nr:MOSC domain-containing protein [Azonexus fungiphilus]RKT51106.1 MOSC domain-containing protein YiiM [Azonexus fungiphilus]